MKGASVMRKRIFDALLWAILFISLTYLPSFAGDAIPSSRYFTLTPAELPEVLNVGTILEAGNYAIQIKGQPVVTKSANSLIAYLDMKYLIVRVGITNLSEETIGWLAPDSFHVQETYMGHAYGTYALNTIMSAKSSVGYSQPAFYEEIEAGKTMDTTLVFDVFPEAQGWVFEFTPKMLGNAETEASISFQLPKALVQ